jgi:N-methylhydantoinase A
MSGRRGIVAGIDVGGTYTDIFHVDESTGAFGVAKVPTNRADLARGCVDGLIAGPGDLARLSVVVHGTTVGTNALLERRGAKVGMIATRGFRDVLELRRRDRPRTWQLWGSYEPVVSRDLSVEVDERTLADGTIRQPVRADQVEAAARALRDAGAEALCIVFVNAYANDANERAAVAAAKRVWRNDHVVASSQILPEIREFERASTTALNAYLQPVIARYLAALERQLEGGGFAGEVLVVQSNGGVMSVDTACRLPVRTALSGPAAGVIAGAQIAAAAGFPNVITCDMGGTSFDVSLVAGGAQAMVPQTTIDFGLVIRTPMIEITTIGAGGGSIASIDRGGLLQVGPESAGSDPGPACYGLGNDRATVTDANLVLGRINPERPIGGKLARLDIDAARAAVEKSVGRPLGLDLHAAADAIIRVANARMAGAIRLVSVERGHDPRKFALMPFGGGGALHAGALMREVGLARAVVPRYPGVTSAMGCVVADMRQDFVQTLNLPLNGLDVATLDRHLRHYADAGLGLLADTAIALEGREVMVELDMSYAGQTHTVTVPLPLDWCGGGGPTGVREDAVRAAFERRYREVYQRLLDGIPVRVLSLRTTVIGRRPKFDLAALAPAAGRSDSDCVVGERTVWASGGPHTAKVYDRLALPVGAAIVGPAILEQPDTTVFVDPGLTATVDRLGNLILGGETPLTPSREGRNN